MVVSMNWNAKHYKSNTLCLGVEPSFRAIKQMTGACTNRYTNRDMCSGLQTTLYSYLPAYDTLKMKLLF